jgi:hypothetical protein
MEPTRQLPFGRDELVVSFARDQRQETTLRLLAECLKELGGLDEARVELGQMADTMVLNQRLSAETAHVQLD